MLELVDELLVHGRRAKRVDAWSEDWMTNLEAAMLERRGDGGPALGEAAVGVVLGVADGGDVGEVPREKSALGPSKAKSKKGVKAEGAKSSAVKEFNALFGGTRGMEAIEERKRRHRGLNLSTRAKR